MRIGSVEAELFRADGQRDRQTAGQHDEANNRSSKFCERAEERTEGLYEAVDCNMCSEQEELRSSYP
jgi:hypothetical protein